MTTLERIMEMRENRLSDREIINTLTSEGVSPREINESFSQANIKSSIYRPIPDEDYPENYSSSEMTPSIMPSEDMPRLQQPQTLSSDNYNPQASYAPKIDIPEPSEPREKNNLNPQSNVYDNYPSANYNEYPEYQIPQPTDIDTISDIAEQIIEEKIDKIRKQISSFTKNKDEIVIKLDNLHQRLEILERKFDDLQMAIIRRMGEYTQNIEGIYDELRETQNSFSKIIDPLTDNIRKLEDLNQK